MLKKELMEQLNNENHYTVPKYVLTYSKELGLDMNSLILLIYFLNKPNKMIFDYKKIISELNFTEKELLNALSTLKDKNILLILMEKNDSGILEEKVDISLFYDIIFSNILNNKDEEKNEKDLYDTFEKEFGRTLSPMEYEIINSWLEQGINRELILSALKEAVFNGVNNLRYVDKILYEWNKKGIKKVDEIKVSNKKIEDDKEDISYEYDWLNED
ncbi:MAG: DnaD domain-containing protein [Candidatus Aphodocola sp.]